MGDSSFSSDSLFNHLSWMSSFSAEDCKGPACTASSWPPVLGLKVFPWSCCGHLLFSFLLLLCFCPCQWEPLTGDLQRPHYLVGEARALLEEDSCHQVALDNIRDAVWPRPPEDWSGHSLSEWLWSEWLFQGERKELGKRGHRSAGAGHGAVGSDGLWES